MITIATDKVALEINKQTTFFKLINKVTNRIVVESVAPVDFQKKQVSLSLKEMPDEYFYGGGVQNGRFSHKERASRLSIPTSGLTAVLLLLLLIIGLRADMGDVVYICSRPV